MKYQRIVATLLGASTLLLLPSAAHASTPTETKTITVSAPYTDPEPSEFDGAQCAGLDSTPTCGVRFVGTSTWSGGTITGDEHYDLAGGPTADGKLTYAGPAYITGTIEGCGSGTFIIDNYDGYIDYAKTDPNDNLEGGVGGSAPGFNHWKIRAGSGTGGLAGLVSGGGVNNWRIYNQGTAGLGGPEGIGLFTGTITCQVPGKPAPPPRTETRTVNVHSALTAPLSQPTGVACRGVATGDPWCGVRFYTDVTLTGTLSGTGGFADGVPAPDGHNAAGSATFEQLKIEGCGEGGLIFDAVADADFVDTRVDDVSTPAHETWTVRPLTGTGGLAAVVGGDLVNDWRAYWTDGEHWARGIVTGTITCELPMSESSHAEPRVGIAGATGGPRAAVLGAAVEAARAPRGGLPRTGLAAAAAVLAGVALLGAGLVARRVSRRAPEVQ